jgi:hypothetical protein
MVPSPFTDIKGEKYEYSRTGSEVGAEVGRKLATTEGAKIMRITRKVHLRQIHIDRAVKARNDAKRSPDFFRVMHNCPVMQALRVEFSGVIACGYVEASRLGKSSLMLDLTAQDITIMDSSKWEKIRPTTFTVTYYK